MRAFGLAEFLLALPRLLGRLFHVVIDAVENAPLVDGAHDEREGEREGRGGGGGGKAPGR